DPSVLGLADQHARESRSVGRIDAPRERLALAARGGQRMREQAVRSTRAIEENRLLRAAPACRRPERIARLVGKRTRIEVMPLRGAHPTALGQDDGDGLARDELGLIDRLRGGALDDAAATIVAEQ